MAQAEMTWAMALSEAGCYGFLEPVASQAVDVALRLCPEAASLVGNDACKDLRDICLKRLAVIYERPLIKLAYKRIGLIEALRIEKGGEVGAHAMHSIAEAVRDELSVDAGESLRESIPLAAGYERIVTDNFSKAVAEFLGRLLLGQDRVSRELLEGKPITCVTGISVGDADPHRHGRMVMRITTNAGNFYYKPHDCRLDALYYELVQKWFANSVRAAKLVPGDEYAFVEQLVPEELRDEGELRSYWHNLGCLTALFHSLGSRDMTWENIMCCGVLPAALDLETLITGKMELVRNQVPASGAVAGIPVDTLADTVVCTSILPVPLGGRLVSPLVVDNKAGTCLPRVEGVCRTVLGYERDYSAGFEEGYRRLLRNREDVLESIGRHADSVCRQILLNTWTYARPLALLFSSGAMSSLDRRDEVLADLNSKYDVFSPELGQKIYGPDAAALTEGDIPYFWSRAGSRTLYAGEEAVGDFLSKSALEVATSRLERFSEDDLSFELDLIRRCLNEAVSLGVMP